MAGIYVDGSEVKEVWIDGVKYREIWIDGNIVFPSKPTGNEIFNKNSAVVSATTIKATLTNAHHNSNLYTFICSQPNTMSIETKALNSSLINSAHRITFTSIGSFSGNVTISAYFKNPYTLLGSYTVSI